MLDEKGIVETGIVIIIITAVLGGFFAGDLLRKPPGGAGKSISSNILYITNPVYSFSGNVDKISDSTIWVTQTVYVAPNVALLPVAAQKAGTAISPQPTPNPKTITFKVSVGKNTAFSRPPTTVYYLFKTNTPPTLPKVSLSDVKLGQMVTVVTSKDLRTLSSNEFEAIQVQLPEPVNTLGGRISEIKDGVVRVKGYLPNYAAGPAVGVPQQTTPPKEETFNFRLTDETEISGNLPPEAVKPGEQPKATVPKKYSLDELKVNQQVRVYADGEVMAGKTVTALRIEPQITFAAPIVNP